MTVDSTSIVLSNLDKLLPDLEVLDKDVHSHPELSMQETRTAHIAAVRLAESWLRSDNRYQQDRRLACSGMARGRR